MAAVKDYIENFYNLTRIKKRLGFLMLAARQIRRKMTRPFWSIMISSAHRTPWRTMRDPL
jgi:hypothetical protein